MSGEADLLTIVVEAPHGLDRESELYRGLVSARLHWESRYHIVVTEQRLNTKEIKTFCKDVTSKYIVFMQSTHQISKSYIVNLISFLSQETVYLAEPRIYMGIIPPNPGKTKLDTNYFYNRDTDIYGIAFNTKRLAESLETLDDLDRASLYTAYRLYWSIDDAPVIENSGYSVASVTKVAIGLALDATTSRLLPLISTSSLELRLYILRELILFLRGIRGTKKSNISIFSLRELINFFDLGSLSHHAEALNSFELGLFKWLENPSNSHYLYKQLSQKDSYLVFPNEEEKDTSYYKIYKIAFPEKAIEIGREYLSHELRLNFNRPGSYNFYSRPITNKSTIIFFDRTTQADDNAEHLYRYFTKNYPEYKNTYFALNENSKDYDRLRHEGFNLIPFSGEEFNKKFLESDLVVGSQIYNLNYRGKTLANSRFVYLQHGIQLNDMTDWMHSKLFDICIATGKIEYNYLSAIAPVETINSGIPRLETLAHNISDPEHILFMPTWRFNLQTATSEIFVESEYFKSINNILTDPRLLNFLEKTNRKLLVQLHPNISRRSGYFQFSDRVILSELSYSEAIAKAEFVFTDYSSVVLDAAFVGIPIAYYPWDLEDFFEEQPYESRLNYYEDGLGPVFRKHHEIINYIVEDKYSNQDPKFEERRALFFDGVELEKINARIIERMLEL